MRSTTRTFAIGELAKRTGVPIKTIRFYSDQGVLPPVETTDAGYRRYAESDIVRLETVRTLRAAGFNVATIRNMLDRQLDPDDAVQLQIKAIAMQERTLRRQRSVLERMLASNDLADNAGRSRALALLSSAERSTFLRNQLDAGIQDVQVDQTWWTNFQAAAIEGIPEDLDDEQLAAWVELVGMTSEPSFSEAINRTAQPFWNEFMQESGMDAASWQRHQQMLIEHIKLALHSGIKPDSPPASDILEAWMCDLEAVVDQTTVLRMLRHMVETHDCHGIRSCRTCGPEC